MNDTGADHRVRSLRWQVAAGAADAAFAWRAFLRNHGAEVLLPELERQLNATAPQGETVRIPRLHLRLRLASPEELASQLPDAIREQLGVAMRSGQTLSPSFADEVAAGNQPSGAPGEEARLLWSYLRSGFLSWTVTGASEELTASLMAIRTRLWPDIVAVLGRQRQTPAMLFRLFQLIPPAEIGPALDDCLDLVRWDGTRDKVGAWLQALVGESTGCSRHARLGLMAAFLAPATGVEDKAAAQEASFRLADMVASVVANCERSQVASWLAALSPDAAAFFSPFLQHDMREEPLRRARSRRSGSKQPPAILPENGNTTVDHEKRSSGHPSVAGAPRPAVAAILPVVERQTDPSPEAARDLYPLRVAQAGLVLLHPYLCRLLVHCNLMEPGGKVLPPFALPRIAALLHYLATGREEVMEFELGLIKILLGLDPLAPLLVAAGVLTEADRAEVQALLTAVVTHWSALKKTSAQGLRASFLERPGILREIEGGWQLNVERRGWDILLDQLPWSLSLVRLPWMHRFVAVEW